MKIFEKRPLALILCIMLGGFSLFIDWSSFCSGHSNQAEYDIRITDDERILHITHIQHQTQKHGTAAAYAVTVP